MPPGAPPAGCSSPWGAAGPSPPSAAPAVERAPSRWAQLLRCGVAGGAGCGGRRVCGRAGRARNRRGGGRRLARPRERADLAHGDRRGRVGLGAGALGEAAAVVQAGRDDAVDVLAAGVVAARDGVGGLVAVHHAALGRSAPAVGTGGDIELSSLLSPSAAGSPRGQAAVSGRAGRGPGGRLLPCVSARSVCV